MRRISMRSIKASQNLIGKKREDAFAPLASFLHKPEGRPRCCAAAPRRTGFQRTRILTCAPLQREERSFPVNTRSSRSRGHFPAVTLHRRDGTSGGAFMRCQRPAMQRPTPCSPIPATRGRALHSDREHCRPNCGLSPVSTRREPRSSTRRRSGRGCGRRDCGQRLSVRRNEAAHKVFRDGDHLHQQDGDRLGRQLHDRGHQTDNRHDDP